MARVTVEDCVDKLPNRFELVTVASHRARQISSGNPITVERDNDKDTVVSLREIADQTVDIEALKKDLVLTNSKYGRYDIGDNVQEDQVHDEVAGEMQNLATEETAEATEAGGMHFEEEQVED